MRLRVEVSVNRRLFLRGVAFASLVVAGSGAARRPAWGETADLPEDVGGTGATDLAAAPQAIHGRLLRGTADGRVLESVDSGGSWHRIANFGPHCAITRLAPRRNEFVATVALQGHTFTLRSADGRLWRTADARRRAA